MVLTPSDELPVSRKTDPPNLLPVPPDLLSAPPSVLDVGQGEVLSSSLHVHDAPSDSPPVVDSTVAIPPISANLESQIPVVVVTSPISVEPSPSLAQLVAQSVPTQPWASRFSSSIRNLKKMDPPSSMDDGTPSVLAPNSVIAQISICRIAIHQYSDRSFLIFIPSEETRKWVLDVNLWQAGNCAFSVSKWSYAVNEDPAPLLAAPIWVVLRNVPPSLFTFEGLSVIGSAIGDPLYTEKQGLVWNPMGMVKIKVLMLLDKKYPASILIFG
ncbi:hypothetical protein AALP_AA4G131200 [Arabis alpina]|uniref:DUF4283 domain-containing protein n=1 Tax=Arabis alpina TaxID=50452 RepID=A0A087H2Y6_ARAAL|nr:hypothetical protein AALP_AA4G131200 [Arabis alpina]